MGCKPLAVKASYYMVFQQQIEGNNRVLSYQGARTMCLRLRAAVNSSQVCATSLHASYLVDARSYISACHQKMCFRMAEMSQLRLLVLSL